MRGWAVTSPFVGWFSDRIGRRNLIMQVGGAIYILMLAVLFYATPDQTWLIAVLMFLAGAAGSSMTVAFVAMKEHNNPVYASTSVSLLNMFVVGSGAVMQPTIGWLLDRNWDGTVVAGARIYGADAYDIAFASLLVVISIAFVLTFIFKETWCKPVHQQIGD